MLAHCLELLGFSYGTLHVQVNTENRANGARPETPGLWPLWSFDVLEMVAKTINHGVTELLHFPKRGTQHSKGRNLLKLREILEQSAQTA